jgi:hypothetical protein
MLGSMPPRSGADAKKRTQLHCRILLVPSTSWTMSSDPNLRRTCGVVKACSAWPLAISRDRPLPDGLPKQKNDRILKQPNAMTDFRRNSQSYVIRGTGCVSERSRGQGRPYLGRKSKRGLPCALEAGGPVRWLAER